ncbi:Trehalose and maltose hydrolase (possible phosphorylase) [Palleronia marisminoris]|uniref:glycoside hydrolase family 65 protein n=1 Tax=Palleronia marisminoris TaxID=315423 RepID=UPI0008EB7796|nr:glycoside hydrolase family 65 protein [Palleronia marisminoris]SFH26715.1 Trehalose and maltose hydrolase (possible phosphorylase) [Palleronia marisminoris]
MTKDDPWKITFDAYDPETEEHREALFALGNGVLVIRNAVPWSHEGSEHYPGTYLAGAYARFPAEIEGETVEVESLANLPNPLPLTFRIEDGAWFTLGTAEIIDYRHELDLRNGISRREITCEFQGRRLRLSVRHFVSMVRPGLAVLRLRVVPIGWSGRVELRASVDGTLENRNVERYEPYPSQHLAEADADVVDGIARVLTRLRGSGTEIVAAQKLDQDANAGSGAEQHLSRDAESGVPIDLCKLIEVSATDLDLDQLHAAPDVATLEQEHQDAWHRLWSGIGLEAEDGEVAHLLRFHTFHLLQTVSPLSSAVDTGIPARGWHGEGYRGHIFWDELFVFPFLLTRFPDLAREKLLYRWRRLDAAREAAQRAGYRGAMFPWRSASDGREVTPHWQWNMLSKRWMRDDTHLARHIGSAIAYNAWQHFLTTGDTEFLADHGAEMILEVARFWASKAEPNDRDDRYDIRGVVGPDEYHTAYPGAASPGLDNNAYTNVTAVWTLCRALEVLDHVPADAAASLRDRLGITKDEMAHWDRISRKVRLAFHGNGILGQFEGFDRLEPLQSGTLPPHLEGHRLDWALEAIGQSSNNYQMSKQADTLMLFYLFPSEEVFSILERLGYAFDRSALQRTCRYYFDRTMHRSSLSRVVYAGALAEVDPEASLDLFRTALLTDLSGPKSQSVAEGIHLGAMGGVLDVLQRRYFGLSPNVDGLRFFPSYPANLCPMRIDLELRGLKFAAEAGHGEVSLTSHPSNPTALPVTRPGGVSLLTPGESISAGNRN